MRGFVCALILLCSSSAFAQRGGGQRGGGSVGGSATTGGGGGASVHGTGGGSGSVTISPDRTRNAVSESARAKALAGDCKSALDLFDEALRHSIDPTLYRDRGDCHEKLGDIFPAIDDYRAYLSQAPDAADADKVRGRLDQLIKDASQDMAPNLGGGGDFDSEMRGGMTDGSTPNLTSTAKTSEADVSAAEKKRNADADKNIHTLETEEERDRQAERGALRLGRGFLLGVYVWPRYVFNNFAFKFGQGVGAKFGWSFSSSSSVFLELGVMNQLSDGTIASSSGFTSLVGYELRIPFDNWGDNQFFVGAGAGFEELNNANIGQPYASLVVRGRAGYRHVFGRGFGLDFYADGGMMATFPLDPPAGSSDNKPLGAFIGGHVAAVVGF